MTINRNTISCPTCGKKATWKPDNPFRPFCSERCKLIDLGEWAEDNYRIASAPVEEGHTDTDENDVEK